jgi:hypothetical protein
VLKVDIEGAEDRVLVPFFRHAAERLWPGFILIDGRDASRADLSECGYAIAVRTKQNVMLPHSHPPTGAPA